MNRIELQLSNITKSWEAKIWTKGVVITGGFIPTAFTNSAPYSMVQSAISKLNPNHSLIRV